MYDQIKIQRFHNTTKFETIYTYKNNHRNDYEKIYTPLVIL